MRYLYFLFLTLSISNAGSAQYVYTVKADSVKLTGCDSNELIIENHSQGVPGFLFNTGRGRTVFKRGLVKVSDTLYLVGADSLRMPRAWVQGGNSFGATGVLGTLDNNHLDLYTSGAFRGRVTNLGNWLVGTAADNGARLQVVGSGYVGLPNFNQSFTVRANGSNNWDRGADFNFTDSDGVSHSFGLKIAAYNGSGGNNRIVKIFQYNCSEAALTGGTWTFDNDVFFNGQQIGGNNDDFNFRLLNNNGISHPGRTGIKFYSNNYGAAPVLSLMQDGTVGIGTAAPSAQLHTTGGVRFAGLTNDNSQTRVLVSDSSGNLFYRALNAWALNDGIDGQVTAKNIRVAPSASWPDYVFDRGYPLLSIGELEKYIEKNSHLPGMPSATEVEKKGIDVGDNQAALLKKIEELTLYIIKQDKTLKDQQQQINELRTQIGK